ncbi:MAG: cupin domain-containing protein [Longimicrobiales bacterium]
MLKTPDILSDRPSQPDVSIDVVGDILGAVHLTTAVFGRLELGAPWHLRIPKRAYLSFYVMARGSGWIEAGQAGVALSAGDAVLLPHGTPHYIWDAEGSHAKAQDIDYAACKRPWIGDSARFGGDGPVTSIVTGHFTFGGTASRNPLLDSLPALIHLPADAAAANPQLAGVVPLILSESARPGPGATIVLARLADLLLIHALRYWIATAGAAQCGLHAVADPTIGAALRLMHAQPAEPWTVGSLASAVNTSRSAFAARFTKLVGEPPLQYLARWRMTKAALLLSTSENSVAAVADQVGYANPVAFTKAFSRFQGVGPGAYRRAHRPA